jgi:hypothetical protein
MSRLNVELRRQAAAEGAIVAEDLDEETKESGP